MIAENGFVYDDRVTFLYRSLIRPLLFRMESEKIHEITMGMLQSCSRNKVLLNLLKSLHPVPDLPVETMGLRFPNPVGLAAGMDKKAQAVTVWERFGFGFSELGGVTREPQPGNPAPRMFRAIPERALINRMGFNNPGADAFAEALKAWKAAGFWPSHPVGINIGKSKSAPLENAPEDYAATLDKLYPLGDFFVVNVSSPNTPHLRNLQDKVALDELMSALVEVRKSHAQKASKKKPILIKVAPDMDLNRLDGILEVALNWDIEGMVATNTTLERPETGNAAMEKVYRQEGGLSGAPLREKSTIFIRHLYRVAEARLTIVGVGGIFDAQDAWEKITAGASLIQIYTGMVYEGPSVVGRIVRGLQEKLKDHGLNALNEAVGLDHRIQRPQD